MTVRRSFGFCFVLMMAAAGCDDPVAELQPRVLSGLVHLYDELGHRLSTADQVQVDALGLTGSNTHQAFTDASGSFEIELPDDEVVPLLFSRDGYGDMYLFDVEEGAGLVQVRMFATSSAVVTAATALAESCGTSSRCLRLALDVENFFGPGTTRRLLRVYLSTDPAVDASDYEHTTLLVVPNDQPGLMQAGSDATFELDGLRILWPFASGATVHLVIHGATENLSNSYVDPESGLEIFTDLSPASARASFVIP